MEEREVAEMSLGIDTRTITISNHIPSSHFLRLSSLSALSKTCGDTRQAQLEMATDLQRLSAGPLQQDIWSKTGGLEEMIHLHTPLAGSLISVIP